MKRDCNKKRWEKWGQPYLWCHFKYNKPRKLVKYLYDHIDKDTLEIDMINFTGPHFRDVDNRLMSLQLVQNGMTDG